MKITSTQKKENLLLHFMRLGFASQIVTKKRIIYRKKNETIDKEWYTYRTESFPNGYMIAVGFSYNCKLKMRKIVKGVKINSDYYQNNINSIVRY